MQAFARPGTGLPAKSGCAPRTRWAASLALAPELMSCCKPAMLSSCDWYSLIYLAVALGPIGQKDLAFEAEIITAGTVS
ncbi:hypothetical protein ABBQ38_014829 [Trebouxia sp. C0009 RCD-2024]